MRTSRGMRRNKELKRFLFYSLYAWGVPIVLTTITILTDVFKPLPSGFNSYLISDNRCWFDRKCGLSDVFICDITSYIYFMTIKGNTEKWPAMLIYFLLPMGLHVITNSVLFILTAIHCSKVKGEIHRMQKINERELGRIKRRFIADKSK